MSVQVRITAGCSKDVVYGEQTYLMGDGSLGEKLARRRSDTSSETLKDLGDDEEAGRAVGTAGLDHESDTEEADEETSEEEPFSAVEIELVETGANGGEGEGEGLRVGEVTLVDGAPVLGDGNEGVLVSVLEVEGDKVEETDCEREETESVWCR